MRMRLLAPLLLVSVCFTAVACSSNTAPATEEDGGVSPEPTSSPTVAPPTDANALPDAGPTSLPRGQVVVALSGAIRLVGLGGASPATPTTLVEASSAVNSDPSFLPDGRVVYARQLGDGLSRVGSIHVVRADGTDDTTLVSFVPEGTSSRTASPVLGADGRVYFVRGVIDAGGIRSRIMAVDLAGGTAFPFASLPGDCESGQLTAAPGGKKLLVRFSNSACSRPGLAILSPGPSEVTLDVLDVPGAAAVGFDETGTKLWSIAAVNGEAVLKKSTLDFVAEGAEVKVSIAKSLPARVQGYAADRLIWFGESSASATVRGATVEQVALGEDENWGGATFRADP